MTERVTEFVSLAECSYQAPVGIQKANRDNRQRSRLPLRSHPWGQALVEHEQRKARQEGEAARWLSD